MSREIPLTRRAYDPREAASALQKACRRSQVREAVYWGFELWSSYDSWAWKRVHTIASEDIGPADRTLPATLAALEARSRSERKKGGGGMEFVHAVILLATAPKSRIACWAVMVAAGNNHERIEVPDEALDQHTLRGKKMGRGIKHFMEEGAQLHDFDGDLAEIEADYADLFRRMMEKDPTLPKNPRAPRANVGADEKPAQNTHPVESGQLQLGGDR